jgi:hypothetical protein
MLASKKGGNSPGASEDEIHAACCFSSLVALYPNITHELRGKLSNIVLHLELLRESPERPSPERDATVPLAEIALDEVYAFNHALQCLLDLMQPLQESSRTFDLVPVLKGLGVLTEAQAKRQRISAIFDVPADPQPIIGNVNEIRHVLVSLILFVMADIPAAGSLSVKAGRDGGWVWVTIEGRSGTGSNGAGSTDPPPMAAEQRRLHLLVAHSVISRHGGALEVSTPAVSPAVRLSLPVGR